MSRPCALVSLLASTLLFYGVAGASGQAIVTASVERSSATASRHGKQPLPASVLWLVPLQTAPAPTTEILHPPYVLLQKNRMFTPHLLVVPVGTSITFPNADPFFHNVFSLFNGKRFDLGLYEKGSVRRVIFDREGVSYIFCNIHPEMSAVVIALKTPWWARANDAGMLELRSVPTGEYEAHLWVEGADPRQLERWAHRVHLADGPQNIGSLLVNQDAPEQDHTNEFGVPYLPEKPAY